jgi:SAM-dependent methyltransferase
MDDLNRLIEGPTMSESTPPERMPPPLDSVRDHAAVREFFGERAHTWDTKFPDDGPVYAAAVASLGVPVGGDVVDAGCGTGRALRALREAVGPRGRVVGADLTPEMLRVAAEQGRARYALLVEADAARMPLANASQDLVFAAGLVHHLDDPAAGLREFARVVRPGGRLALFHPIGRAALAARRGYSLRPDDVRAEHNLRPLLTATGWELSAFDDSAERYLAVAVRTGE